MNTTPAALLTGLVTALETDVLPHLDDVSARASAFSMVQVVKQLALWVAWDPATLAQQLAPRQAAFADLGDRFRAVADAVPLVSNGALTLCHEPSALVEAIEACDARVAQIVALVDDGSLGLSSEQGTRLERWIVGYCNSTMKVEMQFMTRSHIGKLTRRSAAPSQKASK